MEAFGYTFHKSICPIKDKECKECLLKHKCVYTYIFETPRPPDSNIMRKYETVPRPFIFEPPVNNKQEYHQDENFIFWLMTAHGNQGLMIRQYNCPILLAVN